MRIVHNYLRRGVSRRVVILLFPVAIAVSTPSRAFAEGPWTTVGSAGTVDELDTQRVVLDRGIVSLALNSPVGTLANIRYNVTAVTGVHDGIRLIARFRDNGNARVTLRLREVDVKTGLTRTVLVLDSNDFAPSDAFQVQAVPGDSCDASTKLRFASDDGDPLGGHAYFVDAALTLTGVGGRPALEIIKLEPCVVPPPGSLNGSFIFDAPGGLQFFQFQGRLVQGLGGSGMTTFQLPVQILSVDEGMRRIVNFRADDLAAGTWEVTAATDGITQVCSSVAVPGSIQIDVSSTSIGRCIASILTVR